MDIKIDLDEIWVGDVWESTVGDIIRSELVNCIKLETRKHMKNNASLKKLIKQYQDKAIKEAFDALGGM